MVGIKRFVVLVILALIRAGLSLSSIADTSTSVTHSNIPDSEVSGSVDESADTNSSTTATITITWTIAPLPDE